MNPIAKPIPQGRSQASLQDTISELNMHKTARNGLEVSRHSPHLEVVRALSRVDLLYDIMFCINNLKNEQARIMSHYFKLIRYDKMFDYENVPYYTNF